MNKFRCAIAVVLGGVALTTSLSASANFVGAYDPGTWTTTFLGSLNLSAGGGPGSTSFTSNPSPNSTLTIVGGNTNLPLDASGCLSGTNACEVDITHVGGINPLVFHWSYATADDPGFDPFGMIVNGVHIQLATTSGTSGNVVVNPGSIFGWYINCTDCVAGAATATITQFSVPEPASLALLGLGLIGVAAFRKRQA